MKRKGVKRVPEILNKKQRDFNEVRETRIVNEMGNLCSQLRLCTSKF